MDHISAIVSSAMQTKTFLFSTSVTLTSIVALTFTPNEITALVIAIGGVVAIIFAGLVNLISVLRTTAKKVEGATLKIDEVAKKVDVVEGHVNSAASRDAAIIESQKIQMRMLRETILNQENVAALLAQSRAVETAVTAGAAGLKAPPVIVNVPAAPATATAPAATAAPDAAIDKLASIDANTKAIEQNTAATDATVQDLKAEK